MTEASLTKVWLDELRERLVKMSGRAPRIYKHSDRFTTGVPDTSVTWNQRTTWIEFKLVEDQTVTLRDVLLWKSRLQFHDMVQLAQEGHAIYVVFFKDGGWKTYNPIILSEAMNAGIKEFERVPFLSQNSYLLS